MAAYNGVVSRPLQNRGGQLDQLPGFRRDAIIRATDLSWRREFPLRPGLFFKTVVNMQLGIAVRLCTSDHLPVQHGPGSGLSGKPTERVVPAAAARSPVPLGLVLHGTGRVGRDNVPPLRVHSHKSLILLRITQPSQRPVLSCSRARTPRVRVSTPPP